jgi:hypothetical protein
VVESAANICRTFCPKFWEAILHYDEEIEPLWNLARGGMIFFGGMIAMAFFEDIGVLLALAIMVFVILVYEWQRF